MQSGQRGQRKKLQREAEGLLITSNGNGERSLFKRWSKVIRFYLKEIMVAAFWRLYWVREGKKQGIADVI